MTFKQAKQIANLLNTRNQLTVKYHVDKVLTKKENYVFIEKNGIIIACAESKDLQWYQSEILHVSVNRNYEGQGYGSKILNLAELKAKSQNSRITQCTIRKDNTNSLKLFKKMEYKIVNEFHNVISNNWIYILQKLL